MAVKTTPAKSGRVINQFLLRLPKWGQRLTKGFDARLANRPF